MSWVVGYVQELQSWNERLYSVRVAAEVEPYKAGQYNRLRLKVGGEFVSRPYSYVNPPGDGDLEFHFVRVEGGPLSCRLSALQRGDAVELMPRSSGSFTLDSVPEARHLWLFATGTGVGPFLSILATDEPWQRFEQIRLIHGVRWQRDLAYSDRLMALADRHPGQFIHVPISTRDPLPLGPGSLSDWGARSEPARERAAGAPTLVLHRPPIRVRGTLLKAPDPFELCG